MTKAFKIIMAVLVIIVLVFFGIFLYQKNTQAAIKTSTVVYGSMDDTVNMELFAFRDEHILEKKLDDYTVLTREDGDKISDGQQYACRFESKSEVKNYEKLTKVKEKIKNLKKVKASGDSTQISTINYNITEGLKSAVNCADDGRIDEAADALNGMNNGIMQRNSLIYSSDELSDMLKELKREKKAIKKQSSSPLEKMRTDYSGYFSTSLDGYEKSAGASDIDNLNYKKFVKVVRHTKESDKKGCKVIGDDIYYVAEVEEVNVSKLTLGNDYYAKTTFSDCPKIKLELVKIINAQNSSDKALVVFKCYNTNKEIILSRKFDIDLVIKEQTGLLVDSRALRKVKLKEDTIISFTGENGEESKEYKAGQKVQGVYVLRGAVPKFIPIVIKGSENDMTLCDYQPAESDYFTNLRIYDEVVISGSNLRRKYGRNGI